MFIENGFVYILLAQRIEDVDAPPQEWYIQGVYNSEQRADEEKYRWLLKHNLQGNLVIRRFTVF